MPVNIILHDELAEQLERQAESRQLTLEQWAIEVLSRAPQFADQPEAWRELNARRFELIRKRHNGGLSESETTELAILQETADRWLEPSDRRRLEMLQPYEELAGRLTQQSDG